MTAQEIMKLRNAVRQSPIYWKDDEKIWLVLCIQEHEDEELPVAMFRQGKYVALENTELSEFVKLERLAL